MSKEINAVPQAVLQAYLKIERPGYALLVDAPWGAGKSHFILEETDHRTEPSRLYVSLYGVSSVEDFESGLMRAMQPFQGGESAGWLNTAWNIGDKALSGSKVFDGGKAVLTEIALASLPDTLIFDDLERCLLDHQQLGGLLNRYVEHEGKRVILVANSEKIASREDFDATKEKFIGRRILIEANAGAMLAGIWSEMPEGQARAFLSEHQDLLLQVFEEAGHNNLRLLRQTVLEVGRFVDVLAPEFLEKVPGMRLLAGTFVALSMAYSGGRIGDEDLAKRGSHKNFLKPKNGRERTALQSLIRDHSSFEIGAMSGACFPTHLGVAVIGRGFAAPEWINQVLRETHRFDDATDKPDWIQLWNWGKLSEAELTALLERFDRRLGAFEITEPGEILQVFGARMFLSKNGGLEKIAQQLVDETIAYITRLAELGRLPARDPHATMTVGYGYTFDTDTVTFGGYGIEIDALVQQVLDAMIAAQDAAYDAIEAGLAAELFGFLRDDPRKFADRLEHKSGDGLFSNAAILHQMSPQYFASELLTLNEESRGKGGRVCRILKERRAVHRTEFLEEHPWFIEMTEAMQDQADARSKLYGAQVRLLISRELSAV